MRRDSTALLSLRGTLGFISYGSVYSCRVGMDLDTRNDIVFLGVGPGLAIQLGPIRTHARGSLGIGYFVTTSGLSGGDDWTGQSYANTYNFDDLVFQKGLGGCSEPRLSNGRPPGCLVIGTDYHHSGMASSLSCINR